MQAQFTTTRSHTTPFAGKRLVVFAAVALLGFLILPLIPILAGVLLVITVALCAWSPELQPYLEPLLRIPVAEPAKRRARLLLAAGVGVLLVVAGSTGATLRGTWRSKWQQHKERIVSAEDDVAALVERAREHLAAGDLGSAEIALLDAALVATDSDTQEEVEDLLMRVRRSGDSQVILDILTGLSPAELEALEEGSAVPDALDFGEQALTYRAVEIALAHLGEAQRMRAGR